MVAGDVDDARALARLAQQLLDDVVVRLAANARTCQAPAVDDVADEKDRLGLVMAQEIDQESALAGFEPRWTSEMNRVRKLRGFSPSMEQFPVAARLLCSEFEQPYDGCG